MPNISKKQENADDPMFITSISHMFDISSDLLEQILKITIFAYCSHVIIFIFALMWKKNHSKSPNQIKDAPISLEWKSILARKSFLHKTHFYHCNGTCKFRSLIL